VEEKAGGRAGSFCFLLFLIVAQLGGSQAYIVLKSDYSEKKNSNDVGGNYFNVGGKFLWR
jgi:hypothetical protein